MEVVSGKCIICDECNYVLSESNKKVYLELLKRFNIVNVQYYTAFSQLYNLQSLCVLCAYGLKSCAANLDTIKKKWKGTKKRPVADKSCSLCFETENVILCIANLKEETATYLDAIKADINVNVKRLCINCFHCITVRNNLSKRVHKLMTSRDAIDSEDEPNKRSAPGKTKTDNKRKREPHTTQKQIESTASDSDEGDSVNKRRRLAKQTKKTVSKKTENYREETSEDLDDMLQHLETVDAVINAANIHLNSKVTTDKRMMFDISYVKCELTDDLNKLKSSNGTEMIEISDDDVNTINSETSRVSKRVKNRPNYALISRPRNTRNKSTMKCDTCGEHFLTIYKLNLHKAVHDSSKVNGKKTRSKAARKEMYKDTDTEKECSETENDISENSQSELEEIPEIVRRVRPQRNAKMSKNIAPKKEDSVQRNTRSLKRNIRNKVVKDADEKVDPGTGHEENSESENDVKISKRNEKKGLKNNIASSESDIEKRSDHSEIEDDDNTEKSKESVNVEESAVSESENEKKSEQSETEVADNTEKTKEKPRSPKQKNKNIVSKTKSDENDEKSEHSEIEDDDNTERSRKKACLKKEKRKSNESNVKTDEDKSESSEIEDNTEKTKIKAPLEKGKRNSNESKEKSDEDKSEQSETEDVDKSKRSLRSKETNSVNKTKKENAKTRSPKGKRNNIKDKETFDDTSESEHENNSTKKTHSPKIKKARKSDEHLENENLTTESSKLAEGENNNENVDETEENEEFKEESEKEVEDEDNKSTEDNQVESETVENSSKDNMNLTKEKNSDDSEKEDIEETDKDSENEDVIEQKDISIADESSVKNVDNEIEEESTNNEEENMNEDSDETNDKETEIEEESLSKKVGNDCVVVDDDENDTLDNDAIKTANEDAASDTTEILSDDFNQPQNSTNAEENPVENSEIDVEDGNSEFDSLKLSSSSTNDTENEKSGKSEETISKGKSTGKNNPTDFNYVEKLLENLGAMANGNKERTFKIQLNSAKDNS